MTTIEPDGVAEPNDVFISYAREDLAAAEKLALMLERRGWTVWWDRELMAGSDYSDVIDDQLQTTRAVIVLWSPSSIESNWVRAEASAALERRVLIPVVLRGARMPLPFRTLHAVELGDWPAQPAPQGVEWILTAVRSLAGPPGEPLTDPGSLPPPPRPSGSWDEPAVTAPVTAQVTPAEGIPSVEPPRDLDSSPSLPGPHDVGPAQGTARRPRWMAVVAILAAVVVVGGALAYFLWPDDDEEAAGGCATELVFRCETGDVFELETRLSEAGFTVNGVNRIFGDQTLRSLHAFQAAFGFPQEDRVEVGGAVWDRVAEVAAERQALRRELSAAEVTQLQQLLNAAGEGVEGHQTLNVDGLFGPKTTAALVAFEIRIGANPDGVIAAGDAEWDQLEAAAA